jgi:hypothetical protein
MHGGAQGSGGQTGNRNARKHGRYSGELLRDLKLFRALAREAKRLVEEV